MMESNGGELAFEDYEFECFPFLIIQTEKESVGLLTIAYNKPKKSHKWLGFPENGTAIGSDGYRNLIFLMHSRDGLLGEKFILGIM